MPAADRIRNVALLGHRGSGKTSLNEALLFEAGVLTRLGSVLEGSTVSDSDPDEKERQMSISAALSSFDWREHQINLIDAPGDPSFIADAIGALQVCESAIFVINAVMGVEVATARLWERAAQRDIARMLFVNMLDRERADFFRTLTQLKEAFGPHVVATEIPIGSEHEVSGVIDLVDMRAFRQDSAQRGGFTEIEIPADHAELAGTYRERLMDEVAEVSDALMERYLDGQEISHEEIVDALERGTNHGHIFPVVCGVATRNLGTTRLLDAIVEDLPSPVQHGPLAIDGLELAADPEGELCAYVFKTRADPFAGRINLFRVYRGTLTHDSHAVNARSHAKERIGQLLGFRGSEVLHLDAVGPGQIGAVAKLKETHADDWLLERWPMSDRVQGDGHPQPLPGLTLPAPVMAFAVAPKSAGDEEKMISSLRRLQEEDPVIDLHRDAQTGEEIVAGISQVHVEVMVERLRRRFGVEVSLQPPRVPYRETIRTAARAHGRHKKQSGGRGQFGDCHIEIEPLHEDPAHPEGFQFIDKIKGGVIPGSFIPAVEKGVREAMESGVLAGYPVKDVQVTLFDGAYHSVDSSEIAFKLAGMHAMKEALRLAEPVLLEPIMLASISVPESSVGDVIGDLNSRRGRPQGMEPAGAMTDVKAEVPMAEMLSYAPDLRAITGGQGDYTMEFVRYEEVPAHLAQRIVEHAVAERTAAHA
jgi:elongation factor G